MTQVVGSYGLIAEPLEWHISAGADSYAGPFTLNEPAPSTDPIDLTGYTAACEVRTKPGETLLASLSSTDTDPTVILGGADGTVLLWLPSAVSALWGPDVKKGVFDVELTKDGVTTMLGAGTVVIRPNVTTGAP